MTRLRTQTSLFFLLVAWFGVIAFALHMLLSSEINRWKIHFDEDVRTVVSDVKQKLDTNEAVLAGFSAFLQAVDRSDTDSTIKYAAAVASAYPHIYMIEVARKVALSEQRDLEASLRRGWRADFLLKDFARITKHPAQDDDKKAATWPILFMYPSLPESQAIYGVRLESVDFLSRSVALAQKNTRPVVSPVFKMYEGGEAYILLQEVSRPSSKSSSDMNFFGNTMMALLLIKTQALMPKRINLGKQEYLHVSATLAAAGNADSLLFEQQAVEHGKIDRLFLPNFTRRLTIENFSQPTVMVFDRQLRWADLLSRDIIPMLVLLGGALVLVPWVTVRHYLALDRAAIEHKRSAYLATHDLLTNLPNRFLFMDRFEQAFRLWQRNGNSFALLLIDLDRFKEINDSHGHEVGDQVLIGCSQRMASQLRACDTVARHGGDEFVILLGNILNSEDAKSVGEKILAAFAEPIETSAGPLQVSCSIGISICPLHGESLDILRKSADRAMYLSKEQGRNTVSVFSGITC